MPIASLVLIMQPTHAFARMALAEMELNHVCQSSYQQQQEPQQLQQQQQQQHQKQQLQVLDETIIKVSFFRKDFFCCISFGHMESSQFQAGVLPDGIKC